jgi:ribosomal protein S12 methylthiotransferase
VKYYLDPFGCVKNQVDAENMMAFLDHGGWTMAENAEDADLVIVNSCGFIESAKRESINAVLSWRKLYPEKKIILAGCLAQSYAKDLAVNLPEADGLFGINDLSGIVQVANDTIGNNHGETRRKKGKIIKSTSIVINTGNRPLLSVAGTAYVKISEGCDNRCSFCAIPLIRGKLKSRAIQDVVKECKTLLSRGIKELCLIGQDTGSYGTDWNVSVTALPVLMEAIAALERDFRVRLLYTHPDHFPLSILDIIEHDKRFLPYFDIPFQHGSDKLLKAMNRQLGSDAYLDLIRTIRHRLPDAVIRSTFMTGFPGETEEDFALLLNFQKKAALDWMGCFAYSREEDTPSYRLKPRVTKKTAAERKQLVEELQIPITEKAMNRFIGRTFDVLIEEEFEPLTSSPEETSDSLYLGRLPCHTPEVDGVAVIFSSGPLVLGALVPCRVVARRGFDLEVRVI